MTCLQGKYFMPSSWELRLGQRSRFQAAKEYLLQRFNPVFLTLPRATRSKSSLCIIFSLYSGRLDEMSRIPKDPPTRKISNIFWTRTVTFPIDSTGLEDAVADSTGESMSFTSPVSAVSFIGRGADTRTDGVRTSTRSSLERDIFSERIERCDAMRKVPSSSRASTTVVAFCSDTKPDTVIILTKDMRNRMRD